MLEKVFKVYEDLFSVIGEILPSGARLVLVVPEYKTTDGWDLLDIEELYEEGFTKVDLLGNLPRSDSGELITLQRK